MKGGREDVVSGRLEPQVSGVICFKKRGSQQGVTVPPSRYLGNPDTVVFLLVLARRQALLTASEQRP